MVVTGGSTLCFEHRFVAVWIRGSWQAYVLISVKNRQKGTKLFIIVRYNERKEEDPGFPVLQIPKLFVSLCPG